MAFGLTIGTERYTTLQVRPVLRVDHVQAHQTTRTPSKMNLLGEDIVPKRVRATPDRSIVLRSILCRPHYGGVYHHNDHKQQDSRFVPFPLVETSCSQPCSSNILGIGRW